MNYLDIISFKQKAFRRFSDSFLVAKHQKVLQDITLEGTVISICGAIVFTFIYFIESYLQWYLIMMIAACILMAVDKGRNVRRSRIADERMAHI